MAWKFKFETFLAVIQSRWWFSISIINILTLQVDFFVYTFVNMFHLYEWTSNHFYIPPKWQEYWDKISWFARTTFHGNFLKNWPGQYRNTSVQHQNVHKQIFGLCGDHQKYPKVSRRHWLHQRLTRNFPGPFIKIIIVIKITAQKICFVTNGLDYRRRRPFYLE